MVFINRLKIGVLDGLGGLKFGGQPKKYVNFLEIVRQMAMVVLFVTLKGGKFRT
jgi:hypothetical protein